MPKNNRTKRINNKQIHNPSKPKDGKEALSLKLSASYYLVIPIIIIFFFVGYYLSNSGS
jgi:hypothetical protein